MATKNIREQKPAPASKPAKKSGEIGDRDLDKVTGGMSSTGKRLTSADPCEGGR